MSPQLTDTKSLTPAQVRRYARYRKISNFFVLLVPLGFALWLIHTSPLELFTEEAWLSVASILMYVGFFAIMPAGYFDAKLRPYQKKTKQSL